MGLATAFDVDLAVARVLVRSTGILRGVDFGGAIEGRGLTPGDGPLGAWRAMPFMQRLYCIEQSCMQREYEPGTEVARALHWLVQVLKLLMQRFTFAWVIASVMMSLPKPSLKGTATRPARIKAAPK